MTAFYITYDISKLTGHLVVSGALIRTYFIYIKSIAIAKRHKDSFKSKFDSGGMSI
jgi:hypothetical protein